MANNKTYEWFGMEFYVPYSELEFPVGGGACEGCFGDITECDIWDLVTVPQMCVHARFLLRRNDENVALAAASTVAMMTLEVIAEHSM